MSLPVLFWIVVGIGLVSIIAATIVLVHDFLHYDIGSVSRPEAPRPTPIALRQAHAKKRR